MTNNVVALISDTHKSLVASADKIFAPLVLATLFLICISTSVGTISYLILFASALLYAFTRQRFIELTQHPIARMCWLLGLLAVIGVFYSTSLPSVRLTCLQKLSWLFITPFLFWTVRDSKLQRWASHVLLLALALTLVLSYGKYFHLVDMGERFGGVSIFKDHIVQSFMFAIAVAISLYRAKHEPNTRWYYLLFAALLSVNMLFLSNGRIGYVILLMLFCYAWQQFYGWKSILIPVAICLVTVVSAFYLSPHFNQRIKEGVQEVQAFKPTSSQETSMGVRLETYISAWHALQNKPLFGYGTGGIQRALIEVQHLDYTPTNIANTVMLFDSGYLNIVVQYGLFGLLLFLAFYAALWYYSYAIDPEWGFLMRYVVLMMLVSNFFNTWITETSCRYLFSMMIVIGFCSIRKTTNILVENKTKPE